MHERSCWSGVVGCVTVAVLCGGAGLPAALAAQQQPVHGVPAGRYTLTFSHPVLDSLGFGAPLRLGAGPCGTILIWTRRGPRPDAARSDAAKP